jgi:hypothetical protein
MTCDLVSLLDLGIGYSNSPSTQERPCTRCVKRNIGHLCHDEPREAVKKSKSEHDTSPQESNTLNLEGTQPSDAASNAGSHQPGGSAAGLDLAAPLLPNRSDSTASIAQTEPGSAPQMPASTSVNQPCKLHVLQLLLTFVTKQAASLELR